MSYTTSVSRHRRMNSIAPDSMKVEPKRLGEMLEAYVRLGAERQSGHRDRLSKLRQGFLVLSEFVQHNARTHAGLGRLYWQPEGLEPFQCQRIEPQRLLILPLSSIRTANVRLHLRRVPEILQFLKGRRSLLELQYRCLVLATPVVEDADKPTGRS